MCGIAAIYNYSGQVLDPKLLAKMTHALEHRGPDNFGFCFVGPGNSLEWRDNPLMPKGKKGVGMGHRRLSILDLSDAGRQPFVSPDGRFWMIYNGEIFNYLELKEQLKSLGHNFRTGTDTEVVLAAFMQWGQECFSRFNGMWALLIWDNQERKLVACRDRFGIKPLYYHRINGAVLFASEIKAILQCPLVVRRPDVDSVVGYLARRTAPTNGASFFEDIWAVDPGTCLTFFPDGSFQSTRYWTLPLEPWPITNNLEEAATQLKFLLNDSVHLRLRSDVKVGTMLSGGLDSTSVISIVAGFMSSDSGTLAVTGESLHSFTAGFPGEKIDETVKVDALCQQLPLTKHTVFPLEELDVQFLLKGVAYSMEMPWYNSVPLVHALLMRRAQAEQVKVLLNGHGSDEIYAGYPYDYCPEVVIDALVRLQWTRAWGELHAMKQMHGLNWELAFSTLRYRILRSIKHLLGKGDTWSLENLIHGDLLEKHASLRPNLGKCHSGLDQHLRLDFFHKMLPAWLQFEDRISMAYSLEARLPFMDYRLIEYGFGLPNHLKIQNGLTKIVLRKAMTDTLPSIISGDPQKIPFSGPSSSWLLGPLRSVVEGLLASGEPKLAQFVDPGKLRARVINFLSGKGEPHQIWPLLNTEVWLRAYFERDIDAVILK